MLGFVVDDLERCEGQQFQGKLDMWKAEEPVEAEIPGISFRPFQITPMFLDGTLNVVWGHLDFFASWDVLISRTRMEFELVCEVTNGTASI